MATIRQRNDRWQAIVKRKGHRFKSDAAFDAQLARRVRGLTDANAGSYWDDKVKRTKRVYKDIT